MLEQHLILQLHNFVLLQKFCIEQGCNLHAFEFQWLPLSFMGTEGAKAVYGITLSAYKLAFFPQGLYILSKILKQD